jgi:protein-L-isoaspartate(D-aspartate) O-methyltransferase
LPAKLSDLLAGLGPDIPAHVLRAIQAVPRHHFIAEVYSDEVYKDAALPIGHGSTASRPSTVVAALTAIGKPQRVLEIGTGCGWQTALLSTFCYVYSIEAVLALAERASRDLHRYAVNLRCGNGLHGWPDAAPFGGIILCAAVDEPPAALLDQLTDDGVLVAQVGNAMCRMNKAGEITVMGGRARFATAV